MARLGEQLKRYWRALGPGLTTGAADDDPSGIATYSQTGASTGFQLLWLSLFTFPLMAIVQEMCARMGLVSGRGLAENIRREYPKGVLWGAVGLLFAANTFNIGADIAAMAASTQLLAPALDARFLVLVFAALSLLLQVFTSYETYVRYPKCLTFVLFSYVITGLLIQLDWRQALVHTVVPSLTFSRDQIVLVCAVLGTTISPYLFFWQSSQEVEEKIEQGKLTVKQREGASDEELRDMRVDVWVGMFFSNLVMFFIIAVCAGTLFAHGVTDIKTAAEAAAALRPLAGEWATALFAIGVIGTGLLAIPVLAGSSAYAIAETMHWREGLYKKLREAYGFYGVIAGSILVALMLDFAGIDPIKGLVYSAVGNGLVAPVMLFFIVRLAGNHAIMGKRVNKPASAFIGWAAVIAMAAVGAATIASALL